MYDEFMHKLIHHWKSWVLRAILALSLFGLYMISLQVLAFFRHEFAKPVTLTFKLPLEEEIAQKNQIDPNPKLIGVMLSGNFSGWSTNSPHHRLIRLTPNEWGITLTLPPGDSLYKFILTLENGEKILWTHDPSAARQISDTFGGYNSVISIPDMDQWSLLVHSLLLGALALVILYSITDPIIRWILFWKIPVRFKLVGALFVIVALSNTVFLVYNQMEIKALSKISLQENLNLLHNSLLDDLVDFEKLNTATEVNKVRSSLRSHFYRAHSWTEKQNGANNSITLANIGVLDSNLNMLVLMSRMDNTQQQTRKSIKSGFRNVAEYFEKGVLLDLLNQAKGNPFQRTLFTGKTPDSLLGQDTDETRSAINTLGFNSFLMPIVSNDRIVGYYGGDILPQLMAGEANRIFFFNLYLIGLVALLSALIYTNLGKVLTSHLTLLTQWTESIKAGHYDETHTLTTGDEIQKLAENFDHMRLSLSESMNKLKIEAYRDTLTKMPNRKRLLQDLEKPVDRALILLNIDSFQEINDFFTSEFGDFVLIETAQRLENLARDTTIQTYKIGSDEYVLLLLGNRPMEDLEMLAQSVCDTVMHTSYLSNNHEVYISLSAGLAQFRLTGNENLEYRPSLLLAEADMALKKAKRSPRRILHYDRSMEIDREYGQNFLWTSKVRQALNEDRIVPFYQPIVNNKTQKIEKYECLVRMIETDGMVISPAHFLQISKKSRFYRFITMAMVEKSLAAFEPLNLEFSINLSIEDILDERTQEYLFEKMAQYPRATRRLVFEIVETDSVENYADIRAFIQKVRPMGCKIAIDDFGSGYSNFEHLLQLEIDFLKIDATLIRTMDTDTNAQIITRAISHFAQDLGIKTVAEYVHNEAVYLKACELNLDFSQGYFWGAPQAHILP